MNPDIINSIVTFVVGLFAIGVYLATKHSEKRNAATIVVMDIRHAEQVVLSLLEKGAVDKSLKIILSENNWAKYKFRGKLTTHPSPRHSLYAPSPAADFISASAQARRQLVPCDPSSRTTPALSNSLRIRSASA